MRRSHGPARRGVAAVELAFVFLLFVIPLMIGIWEVGRMVQVQQIVSNATREGARLSAQAYTINSSGSPTQIKVTSGTVNVKDAVYDYMYAAGLTNLQPTDVTVTFGFTTPRTTDYVPLSTDPVGTSYPAGSYPTDPCYGEKGMMFTVTVSIPWSRVRWINMGLINPTTVTFTVTWQMLTDDRFQVNTALPTW
ncbi:pilus assembly protein [Gemmata sp. G18]|uniref:Pilus assembly protein n=1 Tax=Gemmata palustris TaxID=2822762 RepID=A0ABS5BZB9_9BACT|nr:TadE/TadG family type IV pilus assembly protein [Gemmata palustris]MBP3959069.1 pilus assembly protein [Gemmata palustris]